MCELLKEAKSIGKIKSIFDTKMRQELMPIHDICLKCVDAADYTVKYLGIDTSLNPRFDEGGSVIKQLIGFPIRLSLCQLWYVEKTLALMNSLMSRVYRR